MRGLLALLVGGFLAACQPRLAPPGPEQGAAAIQDGRSAELAFFKTRDGYHTTLRRWLPEGLPKDTPKAVILALHGFNDHSTFIAPAAERWQDEGIATYAYDQRGFGNAPNRGLWAGAETYAEDSLDLLCLLKRRYPDTPIYLLGESMGGAVAIAAMTQRRAPEVAGVILAAPAVRSRETLPLLYRASLSAVSHSLPWLALSPRGVRVQASDNIEALRALGRDPLVIKRTRMDTVHGLVDLMDLAQERVVLFDRPVLLLYGAKDELIPPEAVDLLWTRLPAGEEEQRRALYPEGWHLLFKDKEAEVVIDDVAHWVLAPDQPLPSGADQGERARPEDEEAGS